MDLNVKSVLDVLEELGLTENTVVVFSNDYGPARPYGIGIHATGERAKKKNVKEHMENMLGDAGVFRGNKGTVYEGGLRVPFIIRWPGHIQAGIVDRENVIGGIDWLPTICSLAGVKNIPDDLDGEDVSDIWLGASRSRTKPLLWNSGGNPGIAIRDGKWKYYLVQKRGTLQATGSEELYDLSTNPAETRNLAKHNPEVASRLKKKVLAYKAELPTTVMRTGKYRHQY